MFLFPIHIMLFCYPLMFAAACLASVLCFTQLCMLSVEVLVIIPVLLFDGSWSSITWLHVVMQSINVALFQSFIHCYTLSKRI